MTITPQPQVIDYENSQYRTDFWIGQGREYEDQVERLALRRLLPPKGNVLIDIGAGFGRLAPLYDAYETIILADYSRSLLKQARADYGHDQRFMFVAANVYDLPFTSQIADTIIMIRVMHHLEQPGLALTEISRVLGSNKHFVFEFANKRHVKSILRYLVHRQNWNPFTLEPYEFVPLNFDFHPRWMFAQMAAAGLTIEEKLAVSHFRAPLFKRLIPPRLLARLDALLFKPTARLQLSPSIMGRAVRLNSSATNHVVSHEREDLLRCLHCGHSGLRLSDSAATCPECRQNYPVEEGIIDLRMIPS